MIRFLTFTFTTLVTLGLIILVYSFATDQAGEDAVEAKESSGYEEQENTDSDKQSITIGEPEKEEQTEENNQSKENSSSEKNNETGENGDQAEKGNSSNENSQSEEGNQSGTTESEAEERVRESIDLPDEGNYRVEFDHKNDDGDYVVQVFEVVEREEGSHTATYGWYIVDADNGEVESMF
ncbi:hypothetical protein [Alkalibacillus salilacus]|uniref:Cobalamin biosynthesis protein CobT n=1 Tax=Alkalibacillus salilacus TaxID=284582 RepID=A0ABT9VEL2_9BACI|nr:hypothetical protein [Alkalibacillus salilacus]MDQ0159376.1 cobalamin biosynthesis protein CobT [Alkalibacillus salilacus]